MIDITDTFNASILLVDDMPANITLLERILRGAGYTSITSTMNPYDVYELHNNNHYDLILLDLQMPGMDGFEVLKELKIIEEKSYLSVIVITAQPDHKIRALKMGAKDFISKPFDIAEVLMRIQNMLEVKLLHKELHRYNATLELLVIERTADLQESYQEAIFTMIRAAEYKDEDTGAHVKRISYYGSEMASRIGMDRDYQNMMFVASPMHDIGKIGIPDYILLKPGSFTSEEWDVMKGHSALGAKILGNSKSPYLKMGAEIALGHHERFDGEGYPSGFEGEAIPLSARIMNLCDVYDALRSKRPYKVPFDHVKAVEIITIGDGRTQPKHFDQDILNVFKNEHSLFRDIYETYTEMACP